MLKLVKDFNDFHFVYFWADTSSKENHRISVALPTLQHAQEWFINYYYAQYTGIERRKFKQDRRHELNNITRPAYCSRSSSNLGRRITDKAIKVDIDLSKKKIAQLQAQAVSDSSNVSKNTSSAN